MLMPIDDVCMCVCLFSPKFHNELIFDFGWAWKTLKATCSLREPFSHLNCNGSSILPNPNPSLTFHTQQDIWYRKYWQEKSKKKKQEMETRRGTQIILSREIINQLKTLNTFDSINGVIHYLLVAQAWLFAVGSETGQFTATIIFVVNIICDILQILQVCSNDHVTQSNKVTMIQIFHWKCWSHQEKQWKLGNLPLKYRVILIFQFWMTQHRNSPSAVPHGYLRPRTLRPSISTTELAPTIANGTRLRSCLKTFASSSSSSGSGKS